MRNSRTVDLAAFLPQLAREQGWQFKLEQCRLFDNWEKIVPSEIFDHCSPLKISKNVLWLQVENSVWMQQLQYQKLLLLDTVNEFLPNSGVDDIRFVLAEVKKVEQAKKSVRFIAPSEEKIQAFERQISFIKDKEVRDALMRFWYLCNGCQRS